MLSIASYEFNANKTTMKYYFTATRMATLIIIVIKKGKEQVFPKI